MEAFKSYDIRGKYPSQLNEDMARKIGQSLGWYYREIPEFAGRRPRIVVGRDMRVSAPSMMSALCAGLTTAGIDLIDIGMVTTPTCYFAIQRLGADGGVQVTASHNPKEYIGFKVTRELAIPISYDSGLKLVKETLDRTWPPLPNDQLGTISSANLEEEYLDFLAGMADNLSPLKVAVDASNGMAGKFLPRLFQRLPCTLEGIYLEPDGTFPNHPADPLVPANLVPLQEHVVRTGAAIGFCFDGDGDRVAVVDERGQAIGCDLVTALLAKDVLRHSPAGSKATYDLRSSKVVPEVIRAAGGEPVRVRVGHAHVKGIMREIDAVCGGELSGHYYFKFQDKHPFYVDSALAATVHLLNILSAAGKPLSEVVAPLRKYHHSGEINFTVEDRQGALDKIRAAFADGQQDELDGVSIQYPNWWVNVRPSNTEPLLRLTLEADTREVMELGYGRVTAILSEFGQPHTGGH